jgi:MazG family protein
MAEPRQIDRLLEIMARLRDPVSGCPWDQVQTFATIAPYTIEEAYEVAEAAEAAAAAGGAAHLREELGDLLLQVVFHARMAEEADSFAFDDVARTIADKMVRRHPHVFGTERIESAAAQTVAWEDLKAAERRAEAAASGKAPSALDGVGIALPALTRAVKLQQRAARVGFDRPDVEPIFAKIDEEIAEVRVEIDQSGSPDRIADEVGDLLFAVVNLARRLDTDPEQALRGACRKFDRRFRAVEAALAGRAGKASLDEMEAEWQRVKETE